ncbi:hypothetical protein [Kiritimatiella glycovorans]|uniref:Putative disaccharide phosphorylase n=1 Tax=Kiritimatiella glycovorans TaxID=1307763 RepID=A0A0G3ENF7_9BACT|nr:hypothetical protein [Kiritimatiella glycovorans]AKJ65679.1 putative disaccharide phosphorylase [Kiritimatiella glycovorans]
MKLHKPIVMLAVLAAVLAVETEAMELKTVRCGERAVFKPEPCGSEEMVYYAVDRGDGTLCTTARGAGTSAPRLSLSWAEPGVYEVTPRAVSLSGRIYESPSRTFRVRGRSVAETRAIGDAASFHHDTLDGPAEQGPDPKASQSPYAVQCSGLWFDRVVALDALELDAHPDHPFPPDFEVQYCTDRGATWYPVPSARFVHFPDPDGRTVRIPLHRLAVRGVRVMTPRPPELENGAFALRLGAMRARGDEHTLFEMDAPAQVRADWNNLWTIYGTADAEVHGNFSGWWPTDRPDCGGMTGIGSTIWAHWNAMKLAWTAREHDRAFYEEIVTTYPQDENGFLGVAPNSFRHLGHSKHYVTPAIYIAGLARWYLTNLDRAFLEQRAGPGEPTQLERMRRAMTFQVESMDGRSGVLTIKDPENDGTVHGRSSNYWDGWRFGYQSAYANARFYDSLLWMARLEHALGRSTEAEEYHALSRLVRERFNEIFWSEERGRFIGAVDREGNRHDYGFSFVNLEAVATGVASDEHAEAVLEWLDGERIVEGDTSTGSDIYHFRIAPRANTLAAEAVRPTWWDNWTMKVGEGEIGEYGRQIQNGGVIFYVSYYDLMSRLRVRGIGDAMRRMEAILEEFHQDQLRRQPCNQHGSTHLLGILREFPESGLVPLFFVNGILGLRPAAQGLLITPALPAEWNYAGIRAYRYAGEEYALRIERGREEAASSEANGKTHWRIPAEGRWILSPDGVLHRVGE